MSGVGLGLIGNSVFKWFNHVIYVCASGNYLVEVFKGVFEIRMSFGAIS